MSNQLISRVVREIYLKIDKINIIQEKDGIFSKPLWGRYSTSIMFASSFKGRRRNSILSSGPLFIARWRHRIQFALHKLTDRQWRRRHLPSLSREWRIPCSGIPAAPFSACKISIRLERVRRFHLLGRFVVDLTF